MLHRPWIDQRENKFKWNLYSKLSCCSK